MSKNGWMIIIIAIILISSVSGYFLWQKFFSQKKAPETQPTASQPTTPETSLTLEFTDTGKFGFLTGPEADLAGLKEIGAGWIRPHPGPFIWGEMQESSDAEIEFDETDELVLAAQKEGLNILATLWPYADWDQKNRADALSCQVSSSDQFARVLPHYRCNPADWSAAEKWLTQLVERYDGDGKDDLTGLKFPLRYWEISNEPDLSAGPGSDLTFYKGGASGYLDLLGRFYQTIKAVDPEAKILIAGAAGSQQEFLNFWQEVFSSNTAKESFDIGNIHCISSGQPEDLNLSAYKKILEGSAINKPIWITEAENISGSNSQANAIRLEQSVSAAFAAGAEKIFFTGGSLSGSKDKYNPQVMIKEKEYYQKIISQY